MPPGEQAHLRRAWRMHAIQKCKVTPELVATRACQTCAKALFGSQTVAMQPTFMPRPDHTTSLRTTRMSLQFQPVPGVRIRQFSSQVHAKCLGNLQQALSLSGVTVTPRGPPRQFGQYFRASGLESLENSSHRSSTSCRRSNLTRCSMGWSVVFIGQSLSRTVIFNHCRRRCVRCGCRNCRALQIQRQQALQDFVVGHVRGVVGPAVGVGAAANC